MRRHDGATRNVGTSDDIRFEVPQEDAAEDLCRLLESSHSYVEMTDNAWSVHAVPGVDPMALAALLRHVEAWVAEKGLDRSGSSSTAADT